MNRNRSAKKTYSIICVVLVQMFDTCTQLECDRPAPGPGNEGAVPVDAVGGCYAMVTERVCQYVT